MARSRNIKPSFFDNDQLAENDPLGRILFIGLWTIADYRGNFIWREKRIKAKLLPYDNCDIKNLAINLDKSGFIRFYSDGDEVYCNVVNFCTHQNPHKNEREKGSNIPEYSESMRQAIDLKGITINRDKSRRKPDDSGSDRADSLNLIPDSLNLIPDSVADESASEYTFDGFYSIYPKKVGKEAAKKAWSKVKPDQQTCELIAKHLSVAYLNTEKQFIPNPATYINQARWNDEIIDSTGKKITLGDLTMEEIARGDTSRMS